MKKNVCLKMAIGIVLTSQLPHLNAQYSVQLESLQKFHFVKPDPASFKKSSKKINPCISNQGIYAKGFDKNNFTEPYNDAKEIKEATSYTQKLDSFLTYLWNGNVCTPQTKLQLTYDEQGNTTSRIIKNWDDVNSRWLNSSREELLYDEHGRTIQSAYSLWDSEKWVYRSKKNMYFSDTSDITVESLYNETMRVWNNSSRCDKIYAADSTLEIFFNWNPLIPDWNIDRFNIYYYNETGQVVFQHYIDWNELTGEWINEWANTYEYDEDGYQVQGCSYVWETEWVMVGHFTREFDEQGNVTGYYNHLNDDDMGEVVGYAEESTYDAWGNQLTFQISTWYFFMDSYSHEMFIQFFDVTCEATQIAFPPYFNQKFAPYRTKLTNSDYYMKDDTDPDWTLFNSYSAYYSLMNEPNQIEEQSRANLSFYPNPAKDILHIDFENAGDDYSLEFFDMTGRKVFSRNFNTPSDIIISEFRRGIYLLVISDNTKIIQSAKVVLD